MNYAFVNLISAICAKGNGCVINISWSIVGICKIELVIPYNPNKIIVACRLKLMIVTLIRSTDCFELLIPE